MAQIVNCTREGCPLRKAYPSEFREAHLKQLNDHAPESFVSMIVLAESPSYFGGFIYDESTKCTPKKFSHHLFCDLGYVDREEYVDLAQKREFLRRMKEEDHVLLLDCCHCGVNNLHGDVRDEFVAGCFEEHVEKVLSGLMQKHRPKLYFKFPIDRGWPLYARLRKVYPILRWIAYKEEERGSLRTGPSDSP